MSLFQSIKPSRRTRGGGGGGAKNKTPQILNFEWPVLKPVRLEVLTAVYDDVVLGCDAVLTRR
jgi:hypothetical protein